MKASTRESEIFAELEQRKLENEKLRDLIRILQGNTTLDENHNVHRHSIDEGTQSDLPLLIGVECNLPGCVDRKRALIDENKLLLEKVNLFLWTFHNIFE